MEKITTAEILERTDVGSSKTLTRWYRAGLIPPPQISTAPNGRGMCAYWPGWIVFRIREVKARLTAGESLKQIAKALNQNWELEAKRWIRTKPDFAKSVACMARREAILNFSMWAAEAIYPYLRSIGVRRPGYVYHQIEQGFSEHTFIDSVINLLEAGYNPVVLIVGKRLIVVPDFGIPTYLQRKEAINQPVLMVPIREKFLEAFAESCPDLPREPKFIPAPRVLVREGKKMRLCEYQPISDWDFTVDA